MEPASALATAIVAAATILPIAHPLIEVRLRNWENKTEKSIEFGTVKRILIQILGNFESKEVIQQPLLARLAPGKACPDALVYSKQSSGPALAQMRALISSDAAARCFLDFLFADIPGGLFQIGCVHTKVVKNGSMDVNSLKQVDDIHIRWNPDNPPRYVRIEIDGTIANDDLMATITQEHEMFWMEKLK